MSDLNPLDLEQEFKVARRLLKSPEGRHAMKEALLRTQEGRQIVRSEFGISVIDKNEESDKPIVAVLIPTHKKPENETGAALERLLQFSKDKAHLVMRPVIASSVVHWVRNQLLSQLYESGVPFTHVLFMDDDMVPDPHALITLLERNVDVIGAVCTVRQDPPLPNARHFYPETFTFCTADIDRAGIWTIGAIGTGFLLITKKVLDAVGDYYLDCKYEQKYLGMNSGIALDNAAIRKASAAKSHNRWWFEFLKHPKGDGEFGEDISFCLKARECGFEIYADSTVNVGHIGSYPYSLRDYWEYRAEAVAEGKVVPLTKPDNDKTKISLLVPTRGRPENVQRLLDSLSATVADALPEVVLYVDDDDETMRSVQYPMHPELKAVIGPRRTLSECWNEAFRRCTGDIIMVCADDLIFKTKNWDVEVRRAFAQSEDKLLLVFGDDGHWGREFGTHPFLHRKWVQTLGYVTPPYFQADYCDTWLNEIAEAIGRRVYLPFVHEHMHPLFGKAELDRTHKDRLERAKAQRPDSLYARLGDKRAEDIAKLRGAMQHKQELVEVG